MVKRTGGSRRKTRHLFQKPIREKGKLPIRRYLQKFNVQDRVQLKAEPSYHKGMYFRRFHGKTGIVHGKRGTCYEVMIHDKDKQKLLIVHPVHLKKV